VTDNDLHELYALIKVLGVMSWQTQAAIKRLQSKGLLATNTKGELELSAGALSMLSRMKVPV
jgi:hypothetical protein